MVVFVLGLADLGLSTQFTLVSEAIEHSRAESGVPEDLCGEERKHLGLASFNSSNNLNC